MNVHSPTSQTVSFFGDYAFGYPQLELDISLSDRNVANFEGVLEGAQFKPALKVGPHLSVDGAAIHRGSLDSFSFGLANNHTMDFRWEGLSHSINIFNKRGISTFGAGADLSSARAPLRIPLGTATLSIIGACDNFFFQVGEGSAGVAAIGESGDWVDDTIRSEIAIGNQPIVYFHGGVEDWLLPSIQLKSIFEGWIRQGACAVIAHHPHLPLLTDYVDSKPIFYGLGNFVVSAEKWSKYHPLALLSKRVIVGTSRGTLTFTEQVLQLSTENEVARVSLARSSDVELLTALETRVRHILGDVDLYLRCEALVGMLYMENFWKHRLRLGMLGSPFQQLLDVMVSSSSEGSFTYKLSQALGPHNADVYSPLASRRLASVASGMRRSSIKQPDMELLGGLFGGQFHPI